MSSRDRRHQKQNSKKSFTFVDRSGRVHGGPGRSHSEGQAKGHGQGSGHGQGRKHEHARKAVPLPDHTSIRFGKNEKKKFQGREEQGAGSQKFEKRGGKPHGKPDKNRGHSKFEQKHERRFEGRHERKHGKHDRKHERKQERRPERDQARAPLPAVLKATVDKNYKGFGFLVFEKREYEDAFVPPREAESLFHGDRVQVELDRRGNVVAVEVLQHRFRELVGRFTPHPMGASRGGWVVYERKRAREEVFVPKPVAGIAPNEWVRAKLHFHERGPYPVTAEITAQYGQELPASADLEMVAHEYNLVEEHSEAAEREARELTLDLSRDLKGREDLRKVPFITIDGETARDFDDAIYVERSKNGFVLWVAIADVSHYVADGTALNRDAYSRGTSVYFPERAFHMLPRALSENLCSLKPHEPRLAMTARMEMDRTGKLLKTELMESVIHSHRRATYNEIQKEYEAQGSDPKWEYAAHFALYKLLRKKRSERGSIDFDLPEAYVHVKPTGEVISIKQQPRFDAHRLIEEFMIAANEAVTEWIMARDWPFVYRVHEEPAQKSLERFEELAANVGLRVQIDRPEPRIMAEIVRRLEGHPAQTLLNMALLRSMKQAVYSAAHGIHFGLASQAYTHFTSPIRRYPDLVVHRMLRKALRTEMGKVKRPKDQELRELEKELEDICEHCSYRERLASDADREATKLKQVRAMTERLGQELEGSIVGMVESGFFVRLDDPYVEGMVSQESLGDDYYEFDEDHMVFRGRRKKRQFKIGDRIRIRVLKADIDKRTIDFGLAEEA